jgi:hypothetical protein
MVSNIWLLGCSEGVGFFIDSAAVAEVAVIKICTILVFR